MSRLLQPLAMALLFVAAALSSQQAAPTEAESVAAMQRLDQALSGTSAEAYLSEFAPEQAFLHQVHARMVRARLATGHAMKRETRVLRWRVVGEHAVVVVEHVSTLVPATANSTSMCEHALVALRRIDGRVCPVFSVELPEPDFEPDRIVCPFCNYQVDAAQGWIAVPLGTERSASVEGTVFVQLGTGIALEVSVQIAERAQSAQSFLEPLVAALCRSTNAQCVHGIAAWSPPSMAKLGDAITGARAEINLPHGDQTVLHAVAMGRLGHILLLRGSTAAIAREQASIGTMLRGYRLLSVDNAVAEQAAIALDHHCGGVLAGTDYRNRRHQISASGPKGWLTMERCSGFLFEVAFTSPDQNGRVTVRGLAPPPGLQGWTRGKAERWLDDLCLRGKREIDAARDSGWLEDGDGFEQRTMTLRHTGEPTAPPQFLRLLLQRGQLIVADGFSKSRSDDPAVETAVGSLSPLR